MVLRYSILRGGFGLHHYPKRCRCNTATALGLNLFDGSDERSSRFRVVTVRAQLGLKLFQTCLHCQYQKSRWLQRRLVWLSAVLSVAQSLKSWLIKTSFNSSTALAHKNPRAFSWTCYLQRVWRRQSNSEEGDWSIVHSFLSYLGAKYQKSGWRLRNFLVDDSWLLLTRCLSVCSSLTCLKWLSCIKPIVKRSIFLVRCHCRCPGDGANEP